MYLYRLPNNFWAAPAANFFSMQDNHSGETFPVFSRRTSSMASLWLIRPLSAWRNSESIYQNSGVSASFNKLKICVPLDRQDSPQAQ
jgi:hypothetical protein